MRKAVLLLVFGGIALATPAFAAPAQPLTDKPRMDFWRAAYVPKPPKPEKSAEEIRYSQTATDRIADRLGVVDGQANLFRVQLNNGPNTTPSTMEGGLGGNGVKLRFRW